MTVLVTRRGGRRAVAAALALAASAGAMLLGAGSAGAAPTPVTCTLLGAPLNEPVSVAPGTSVQLVLVVPLVGTRVNVGAAQGVGSQPGERLLQGTVTGVVGLTGEVCQAVVAVQSTVSSVVPLPPVTAPTLPGVPLLPSDPVEVPLPGAEVGVDLDGLPTLPPGGSPLPGQPPAADGSGGWGGLERGRHLPLSDFSAMPYGIGFRFGAWSAPAFRYGRDVPGYSPRFGILPEADDDLTRAGTVRALPILGGRVALPVLLAVLMLGAVSGTLVRTWVLRRA